MLHLETPDFIMPLIGHVMSIPIRGLMKSEVSRHDIARKVQIYFQCLIQIWSHCYHDHSYQIWAKSEHFEKLTASWPLTLDNLESNYNLFKMLLGFFASNLSTMAHILESRLNLVHPHSRNKSDFTDLIFPCHVLQALVIS